METLKIKNIKLTNFGVYKDEEIDCSDRDVIGILAEYDGAPTRSNRAGKSLILEAIRYNLVGLLRYKKASEMIRYGEEHMMTEITYIDSSGKTFVIRRGVDKKGSGLLNLDWMEKSRESQEAINDLFGISRDDFDLTLFFKQSDIHGFMNLGPAAMTEYLMKWFDNEHWKAKENLVKEDIKVLKNQLRDNETTIKALGDIEHAENLDAEIAEVTDKLDTLNDAYQNDAALVKEQQEIVTQQKQLLKQSANKIKEIHSEIAEQNKTHEHILELRDSLSEHQVKLEECNKSMSAKVPDIIKLQKKLSSSELQLENLNEKRQTIVNNENGFCPVLQQSCELVKFSEEDLQKLTDERNEKREEIKKIKLLVRKSEEQDKKIKQAERLKNKISGYEQALEAINFVDKRTQLKKKLKDYDVSLIKGNIETANSLLAEYNESFDDVKAQIKRLEQRVGALEQKKKSSEESFEKIKLLENRNVKTRKKLEILQYVQMMFSKNGIPAAELENAFVELEEVVNMLFKYVDMSLTVSLSPDKELKKKEPVCSCGFKFPKGFRDDSCPECQLPRMMQKKNEISLKIIENGQESTFNGDSGGGKTMISFIMRTALTMIIRKKNRCKLNVTFLDEVDTALDDHLAAKIVNTVTQLLTKKLGYDQIFMISHKDEIKNAVPHILKVTKYDDYSTARFV